MPKGEGAPVEHVVKHNLRIGIDARTLGANRITGVERYVRNLIAHLAKLSDLPECLLYVDSAGVAAAPPVALGPTMRMRLVRPGRGWLRARLPLAARADGVKVMHFPATVLPPLPLARTVVTVYDLAFEFFPQSYDPADLRMQQRGARRSIMRARSVIAISEATRDDIVRLYGRRPDEITVTPLGVEQRFLDVQESPAPPGWPDRYLLYVGGLAPRKNLMSLLEAYARARAQGVSDSLVLVGAGTAEYVTALRSKAITLGVFESVVFAGYLADELLPAAYLNARAFAYLSLHEGFGLPVVEALACGAPVIASATSCFPEIVGDAGILVDPADVGAQAAAMVAVLTDEAKRTELAAKSRRRARQFSWDDVAQRTLSVYLETAAQ